MSVSSRITLLVCSIILLLGGCATPRPVDPASQPAASVADHLGTLADLSMWTMAGRISVQTETDGWHGSVFWQQRAESYTLNLAGPLGQGAVVVRGAPGSVTLRAANGRVRHARSPELLMQQAEGWYVPVTGMQHWILGRPAPGAKPASSAVGEGGRLSTLHQSGWQIRFGEYRHYLQYWLPTRINLENGDIRIKVRVNRWEPGT